MYSGFAFDSHSPQSNPQDIIFVCDRLHGPNHVHCSSCFLMDSFRWVRYAPRRAVISYSLIRAIPLQMKLLQSQVAEQLNSRLAHLRSTVSYMTLANYTFVLRLIIADFNKDKHAQLPATRSSDPVSQALQRLNSSGPEPEEAKGTDHVVKIDYLATSQLTCAVTDDSAGDHIPVSVPKSVSLSRRSSLISQADDLVDSHEPAPKRMKFMVHDTAQFCVAPC